MLILSDDLMHIGASWPSPNCRCHGKEKSGMLDFTIPKRLILWMRRDVWRGQRVLAAAHFPILTDINIHRPSVHVYAEIIEIAVSWVRLTAIACPELAMHKISFGQTKPLSRLQRGREIEACKILYLTTIRKVSEFTSGLMRLNIIIVGPGRL